MAVGSQVPMTPSSVLVMTTTGGRGGRSSRKSGQRVVGQHDIDAAGDRVGLDILGPVHRRGADEVAGAYRRYGITGAAKTAWAGTIRVSGLPEMS
jgi:hypothetical protein